jgi:hypothetical protein
VTYDVIVVGARVAGARSDVRNALRLMGARSVARVAVNRARGH